MRLSPDERTPTHDPLALRFDCPFSGESGYRSDGFAGVWSPTRPLRVRADTEDPNRALHLKGPNWFLCSSIASLPAGRQANIHVDRQQDRALAFRGYVVDPPLHQYSAPSDLWSYWQRGGGRYPNGIFAIALLEGLSNQLTLRTDAFGFSPLYYRVRGELVLFGTKPDFLVTQDSEIDPLGTASVLAHGYPLGDRSLFQDVARCPYGVTLRFVNGTVPSHETWFGPDDLPEPDQPFDDAAAARVEGAFQQAVDRCAALGHGATHLPLTSGYDSRRIAGALLERGTPFKATTVRVFRNVDRDLDARHAAEIARHFGFEHKVVELPSADAYAEDDAARRFELCAETAMHDGWVASLMRALPDPPATIVDGFLGDVLAYPGYRLEGADFFTDPERDIERIADDLARTPLQRHIATTFRPGDSVRAELSRYLAPMARKRNVAEFAYMLLRQRRATVLWSQQLMRPGHLMTCPYADLDYIRTVTAVRPEDRCATHVQRVCLERYHRRLASFPGSHAIPADAGPVGREGNRQRKLACLRRAAADLTPTRNQASLAQRMTPLGRAIVLATRLAPATVTRWGWMVRPVSEALLHDQQAAPVWSDDPE